MGTLLLQLTEALQDAITYYADVKKAFNFDALVRTAAKA